MERTHYNNFVVISQSPGEWFHTGQNMSAEREGVSISISNDKTTGGIAPPSLLFR